MVATVGELYEWMQGPLMDHFVCDEPPDATASRAGVNRELCYLPDGLFVGDNLIELRTLRVKVPDGTQSGRQFRLKGKGMPVLRQATMGDLYIQITVETPQNLSKRQRELLEEFDEISAHENSPQSTGFFSRMKEFFGGGD